MPKSYPAKICGWYAEARRSPFPASTAFVGASVVGDDAVILDGVDIPQVKARDGCLAQRTRRDLDRRRPRRKPMAYRRLPEVLAQHAGHGEGAAYAAVCGGRRV